MQNTILIVEDDRSLREALCKTLTRSGVNVITASNGVEAVAAVDRAKPDLVLLDLIMPVMDGLTALKVIREKDPDLAVIVATNLTTPDDSWRTKYRVSDVIIKSNTSLKTVAATILKHLPGSCGSHE